jgi:hypothetical protein
MGVSSIGEIERIRIKILENFDATFVATSGSAQTVSFATPVANSASSVPNTVALDLEAGDVT